MTDSSTVSDGIMKPLVVMASERIYWIEGWVVFIAFVCIANLIWICLSDEKLADLDDKHKSQNKQIFDEMRGVEVAVNSLTMRIDGIDARFREIEAQMEERKDVNPAPKLRKLIDRDH